MAELSLSKVYSNTGVLLVELMKHSTRWLPLSSVTLLNSVNCKLITIINTVIYRDSSSVLWSQPTLAI